MSDKGQSKNLKSKIVSILHTSLQTEVTGFRIFEKIFIAFKKGYFDSGSPLFQGINKC